MIRADGTGERVLSRENTAYEQGVSWSPDGQWIVATRQGPFIDLIRVETGLTLPLAFTGNFIDPVWRP